VLTVTGVGKITKKATAKAHHSRSFAYALYNRQALALLEQIVPFLKSYKRKRAGLILESYLSVTPRNGKYTHDLLAEKKRFEQAVLAIRANS